MMIGVHPSHDQMGSDEDECKPGLSNLASKVTGAGKNCDNSLTDYTYREHFQQSNQVKKTQFSGQKHRILPHSAPSWILSLAEELASSSLQIGATK